MTVSPNRREQIFVWRLHKRIGGKLIRMLERTEHGHYMQGPIYALHRAASLTEKQTVTLLTPNWTRSLRWNKLFTRFLRLLE
jgi:hypothetical protein